MDCEPLATTRSTDQCGACGGCKSGIGEESDELKTLTAGLHLCPSSMIAHDSQTDTRSLTPGDHEFQASPCPKHADCTSRLFCWHCRQLVCTNCSTSAAHRDHSCDDVASSAARLRTLLLNDLTSVDERRRRCDQLEADVVADKHSWLGSIQAAENEIKEAAYEFRALVDRHCDRLTGELNSVKQLRLRDLQSRLEDVAQERSRLDSLWKNIQSVVDASVDLELLLDAGSVHESVDQCLAELTAASARDSFSSHQTVLFIPSDAQRRNPDDAGNLLGQVQVVGGEAGRGTATQQAAGARVMRSSQGTRRTSRHHETQQCATLYYRQLLATLSDGQLPVSGLAVVSDRLYVCRSQSADVEVYDAGRTTYRRAQRSIRVPGMTEPSDMAGTCDAGGDVAATLFISAESDGVVFRVALMAARPGDVDHTCWTTDDRPYGVSLMDSKHLLVLSRQAASVSVLDDDGRPLRRLRLPASVASPWSAVHIPVSADDSTGDLVVCHGHLTLDVGGRQRRAVSRLDWSTGAVTRRFDWVQRPATERASVVHMVVESADGENVGGFLLADQCCDSVQRVDSSLTSHESLLQTSADGDQDSIVEQPRRLCVDSARQRLVVGMDDGRVKVFANGCVVM